MINNVIQKDDGTLHHIPDPAEKVTGLYSTKKAYLFEMIINQIKKFIFKEALK